MCCKLEDTKTHPTYYMYYPFFPIDAHSRKHVLVLHLSYFFACYAVYHETFPYFLHMPHICICICNECKGKSIVFAWYACVNMATIIVVLLYGILHHSSLLSKYCNAFSFNMLLVPKPKIKFECLFLSSELFKTCPISILNPMWKKLEILYYRYIVVLYHHNWRNLLKSHHFFKSRTNLGM